MVRLEPTESSISFVSKQLIRLPWGDPAKQCGALLCKIMMKTCRRGRYKSIQAVASVAANLRRHKPELCIRLLDSVLEELQLAMEFPVFKDQQRTLTTARLLGELYSASLASGQLIVEQLYNFLNFPNADGVNAGKWLVQQNELRMRSKRTRNFDAPPLTAAQ